MCGTEHAIGVSNGPIEARPKYETMAVEDLLPYARVLAGWPERRTNHVGFVGYGNTRGGDKVLIAVDREYDLRIPEAIARVLRDMGARVDILRIDTGEPDKEFDALDEIRVAMRRESWIQNPRRWEGQPFVEDFAARAGYDLLIHGKGGPTPKTDFRYEQLPWLQLEHFAAGSTTFPQDLHLLINNKTWDVIWNKARGGRGRLTDPEGTDLSWTYFDEYYDDQRQGFAATPSYGHLFGHPTAPILEQADTQGVVAGTTCHFSSPFPHIQLQLEAGQVVQIDGGGEYGDAWRDLLEETRRTHYPVYPRAGLFYLWEMAIGTNPKIVRPRDIRLHKSGGFEWERRRSGVIHMGLGTSWKGPEVRWAAERGLLYGHLHVHLLLPTLTVTAKDGTQYTVIRDGRLTAMDDPDVRALAAKYGDPDQFLKEDWIPPIPGLTAPGSYDEYARDPGAWIYGKAAV